MIRDDKKEMFSNRLQKLHRHLGRQARRAGISCYRLYDHDLPEFPFCIEFYEDRLYVAEYKRRHGMTEEEHATWLEDCRELMARVLEVSPGNIFLKTRQRKAGRTGQYQKLGAKQAEFVVQENGLKFIVNLSDYLDTGLFLDHRVTRRLVKEEAQGKTVLNLFAYTGSFSVYAAAGGASMVTTVDLSNTYLQWARRNMEGNGFTDEVCYRYVQADVKKYLKTLEPGRLDIIIMDPPTFSNSQRMEDILDIQRDHAELIGDCLRGLQPGGILYFSTNFREFRLDPRITASEIKDITKATTAFDFEGRFTRFCYRIKK